MMSLLQVDFSSELSQLHHCKSWKSLLFFLYKQGNHSIRLTQKIDGKMELKDSNIPVFFFIICVFHKL